MASDLGEILAFALAAERTKLAELAEAKRKTRETAIRIFYESIGDLYVQENEKADKQALTMLTKALRQDFPE